MSVSVAQQCCHANARHIYQSRTRNSLQRHKQVLLQLVHPEMHDCTCHPSQNVTEIQHTCNALSSACKFAESPDSRSKVRLALSDCSAAAFALALVLSSSSAMDPCQLHCLSVTLCHDESYYKLSTQ